MIGELFKSLSMCSLAIVCLCLCMWYTVICNAMCMDRFLARVVLVPFAYDPPSITPDVLDNLLRDAPAALPHALLVGKDLVTTESSTLRNLSTAVGDVLGSSVDGRLAMQYSLAILGAQKVCYTWKGMVYTHIIV